jgi:hypothetical protein
MMRNYPIVEQLNISKKQQEAVTFNSWAEITANKETTFDNFLVLGNYNFSELISEIEPQLTEGAIISMFSQSF